MEKSLTIEQSAQMTETGKQELYMYSLRKLANKQTVVEINSLTKLHNAAAFFYSAGEMIRSHPYEKYGVIVMDILQFKAVNEFCGRSEGDRLLIYIAELLRCYENSRPYTEICHVRADNFCLCTAYKDPQELAQIADEIADAVHDFPFKYHVHMSFGICASEEERPAVSYLKDCATMALETIKGKFFTNYAFFDEQMRRRMLMERQVENDIVSAMEAGLLVPYIQPKVDLRTKKVIGGEALVRWVDPERGVIAPNSFVPILEKNGYIIRVDKCVWEQVFRYLKSVKDAGRALVPISINVSRIHIYDDDFCSFLEELCRMYEIPPQYVPLELTESAFLEDDVKMYERMHMLRQKGFLISMDDFGTGYSSMNMLKNQPVDEIKMDRTFIEDIENEKSRIILEYMVKMLKALDNEIIIEGIETEEQRQLMIDCGITKAQGYFFYYPLPVAEFDALLQTQ